MIRNKTEFQIQDEHLLELNVIRKKDVLSLWNQIRSDAPLDVWIGLITFWEERVSGVRRCRKPVWLFLDSGNMCYSYLPFSGELRFMGFYHHQYPRLWWIYSSDYYCGHINEQKMYVGLVAIGNVMMAF